MGCHNARTLTCNHVAGTPAPAVAAAVEAGPMAEQEAEEEEEERLAAAAAAAAVVSAAASQPEPRGEVYQ
mgnify:CR=1 FL=1